MKTNRQRGQALIEFALILPIFLFLALAGADLLWLENQKSNLDYITTEAAICNDKAGCNPVAYVSAAAPGLHLNPAQITVTVNAPNSVTLAYTTQSLTGFIPAVKLTETAVTP